MDTENKVVEIEEETAPVETEANSLPDSDSTAMIGTAFAVGVLAGVTLCKMAAKIVPMVKAVWKQRKKTAPVKQEKTGTDTNTNETESGEENSEK